MPLRYLWDGDTAMSRGRPKAELVVTEDERAQLTSFARSRSLPASLSARARIVLSSAEGVANSSIAERLELGKATVGQVARSFHRAPRGRALRRCPTRATAHDRRRARGSSDQDDAAHQDSPGCRQDDPSPQGQHDRSPASSDRVHRRRRQ